MPGPSPERACPDVLSLDWVFATAPAGEQAKITNLLNVAQSDLDRVKGNPGALVTQQHPFASFARLAHAYGLTSCAANA